MKETKGEYYIWFSQSGREQYFDLQKDPQERHDAIRVPQYANRLFVLRRLLVRVLSDREEGFVENEKLISGRPLTSVLHV